MYNHYIRLDINNNIITGFSDCFEQPLETDICISTNLGGQFQLKFSDGTYSEPNPNIFDTNLQPLYKYIDGVIVSV